jgi:predicted transcriptional regulator
MTLTNAQISRIRELYAKGYAKIDIAKKIGCSRKTVIKYLESVPKPKEAKESVEGLEKEFERLKNKIELLDEAMGIAAEKLLKLDHLPIKNIYDDCVCSHCGSKYLIAIKYKCTRCDTEGWWGYHPR